MVGTRGLCELLLHPSLLNHLLQAPLKERKMRNCQAVDAVIQVILDCLKKKDKNKESYWTRSASEK